MNVGETKRSVQALKIPAAILILLVAFNSLASAQSNVLEKDVTIRMNNVKRQTVLNSLSRQTGYTFTFDTELIKPQEFVTVNETRQPVVKVLNSMFGDQNYGYSVMENHIIIYKKVDETTTMISEEGRLPVFLISGTVVEYQTSKPLPYATIGIYKKGIGTISNDEGNFTLKVTRNSLDDSIRISYLGFVDRRIPVNQAIDNHYIIELDRDYVSIPEIIIRTREPLDIIEHIHNNIDNNYGSSPIMLRAFYRESVTKRSKILLYSEAVLDIYKSAYTKSFQSDQIRIFKSRKIENVDNSDTLILRLQEGHYSCLQLDGIKNLFDFINSNNYPDYNYRMTDIVNIGNEAAYLIEFTQRDHITDNALFQGDIYINTDNYGIHSAEFEIKPEYINLLSNNFVKESSRGFSVKLKNARYKIDYRYVNNRYYLDHVRGDMEFHARKKKKLFGSDYSIVFEMAITDIDSTNVKRFSKDDMAPRHTVFSEIIDSYDSEFWGTDNYMHPEIDIQEALKQLNVRLEEFRKEK